MAEQSGEVTPSNAKQRSPVEKCLVWGGIAILAGVVFIEYRAKTAFDSAMTWLGDHENSNPKIEEVRSALAGATEGKESEEAVSFNWFSLFKSKDYEIICDLQKKDDNLVMTGFYTKAGLEAAQLEIKDGMVASGASEDDEASSGDSGSPSMTMPGGPAGGSPGGGDGQGGLPVGGGGAAGDA